MELLHKSSRAPLQQQATNNCNDLFNKGSTTQVLLRGKKRLSQPKRPHVLREGSLTSKGLIKGPQT
eukprot:1159434-Pelagomonas_calceolata.AAC.7